MKNDEFMLRVRIDSRKAILDRACESTGMTMSAVIKALLDALDNSQIEIRGEGVVATDKTDAVNETGYECESEHESEYERLGFAGVLRMLKKKDYPDDAIRRINEQQMIQISDMPKWSARRAGNDWGC